MTIPWVLQFLCMKKWDNKSLISSLYCRETVGLLRSIHKQIGGGEDDGDGGGGDCRGGRSSMAYGTNMLLLALQLESFFADVIGLGATERLPSVQLPTTTLCTIIHTNEPPRSRKRALDTLFLGFSRSFILSSSCHLEELHKLIIDLDNYDGRTGGGGALKKLKPYVLSSSNQHTEYLGDGDLLMDGSLNTNDPNNFFASLNPMKEGKLKQRLSSRDIVDTNTTETTTILPKDDDDDENNDDSSITNNNINNKNTTSIREKN